MNLIKIDATPSTNTLLKEMLSVSALPNFTVVHADHQTQGRGQRGTTWLSKKGNSLTCSVLYVFDSSTICSMFSFNALVAVSFLESLKKNKIEHLAIKWPNDIMAGSKKIAGILIENSLKSNSNHCQSIIGLGCNVLGERDAQLPQAGSIFSESDIKLSIDCVRDGFVEELKNNLLSFPSNEQPIWQSYHNYLFKNDKVATFQLPDDTMFVGKIIGVNQNGQLEVLTADDQIKTFGIKEVRLLY